MIVRVFVYVGQGVVCIQEVLFRYLKPYEKTSKACEWSQIYCVYKHLPLSVSTSGAGAPALLNRHGTNLSLRNNCFSRFSLFVQVKETWTSWPLPPPHRPLPQYTSPCTGFVKRTANQTPRNMRGFPAPHACAALMSRPHLMSRATLMCSELCFGGKWSGIINWHAGSGWYSPTHLLSSDMLLGCREVFVVMAITKLLPSLQSDTAKQTCAPQHILFSSDIPQSMLRTQTYAFWR